MRQKGGLVVDSFCGLQSKCLNRSKKVSQIVYNTRKHYFRNQRNLVRFFSLYLFDLTLTILDILTQSLKWPSWRPRPYKYGSFYKFDRLEIWPDFVWKGERDKTARGLDKRRFLNGERFTITCSLKAIPMKKFTRITQENKDETLL